MVIKIFNSLHNRIIFFCNINFIIMDTTRMTHPLATSQKLPIDGLSKSITHTAVMTC